MDILDDIRVRKLSAKVNYSLKSNQSYFWASNSTNVHFNVTDLKLQKNNDD